MKFENCRKSIVAEKTINPGDQFSNLILALKDQESGCSQYLLGFAFKKSSKKYKPGDLIDE